MKAMVKGRGGVKPTGVKRTEDFTSEDVECLLNRVKVGIKEKESEPRREEPGLTEEARRFVIRF